MKQIKWITGFLAFLSLIAAIAVLKLTADVCIPLVIAILLTFIFSPFVVFLSKRRIPKIMGIVIVVAISAAGLYLVGLFFYASVLSFTGSFSHYQQKLVDVYASVLQYFHISSNVVEQFDWFGNLSSVLLQMTGTVMDSLKIAGIVFLFLIFMLLEVPYFNKKIYLAFNAPTRRRFITVINDITRQIGRYLTVKFIVSLSTGFLVWLSLFIIGMDFAIIWGVLAFLLNFIPNIGSFFVIIITCLMGIIQFYPHDIVRMVLVIFFMNGIQFTIGNVLEPRMHGRRLDISPFLILFSLLFWGWIWGFVGMFLAVPLMAAVKICCQNIEALRPVSILMGTGRHKKKVLKSILRNKRTNHEENTHG